MSRVLHATSMRHRWGAYSQRRSWLFDNFLGSMPCEVVLRCGGACVTRGKYVDSTRGRLGGIRLNLHKHVVELGRGAMEHAGS